MRSLDNVLDVNFKISVFRDVLGSWKHYNLSRSTLDSRNRRETSPLVSRELDRYAEAGREGSGYMFILKDISEPSGGMILLAQSALDVRLTSVTTTTGRCPT